MPAWLLSLLLQVLWKLGAPLLKKWISAETKIGKWLREKFPNIDWDNIVPVLEKIDKDKKKGKDKLRECVGAACAMKPVQD